MNAKQLFLMYYPNPNPKKIVERLIATKRHPHKARLHLSFMPKEYPDDELHFTLQYFHIDKS